MNAKATPAKKPTPIRKGVCPAADRFRQVIAIIRADYELPPGINDEIERIARALEKCK